MKRAPGPALCEPVFFESAGAFRAWLRRHADTTGELVVGFHKRGTGRAGISWPGAVDEALCVGWIDGVRKRIDDQSYQVRFTPRKASSNWSAVNIERMRVLAEEGRIAPAGRAAFERRIEGKSRTYSYEQAAIASLLPEEGRAFRKRKSAWTFFKNQPASYRKTVLWRIASAKRQSTRARRLAELIEASGQGRRIQ